MSKFEEKRAFLVVSSDEAKVTRIINFIKKKVTNPTLYTASNSSEALFKLSSMPPNILITDYQLHKTNASQIIDSTLKGKKKDALAVIITDTLPKQEKYIDEIVTGKVQFVNDSTDEVEFTHCLFKACNFSSLSETTEYHVKFLEMGAYLMKQNEKAEHVYILKQGKLRAFRESNGKMVDLGMIDPGEFIGEMAYINGEPRSATVEAMQDCELIEIPIGSFERVLYRRPAWARTMMATLCKRLRQANSSR